MPRGRPRPSVWPVSRNCTAATDDQQIRLLESLLCLIALLGGVKFAAIQSASRSARRRPIDPSWRALAPEMAFVPSVRVSVDYLAERFAGVPYRDPDLRL